MFSDHSRKEKEVNIIVTGGFGFIGNCFYKLLLKERLDWYVISSNREV